MNQIAGSLGFVLLVFGCFSMLGSAHMMRKIFEAQDELQRMLDVSREATATLRREKEEWNMAFEREWTCNLPHR